MKLMPALILLVSLAACAQAGTPTANPGAASTAPGSVAPVAPANQTEPIDCGVQLIPQGGVLSETAMACVIDAAAKRRPAKLEETRPTVEGDPITTRYVVRADGVVEVTRDTTRDRFGNAGVTTQRCTGPFAARGMLAFAHCEA